MTKFEKMQQKIQVLPAAVSPTTHVLRQALTTTPVLPETPDALALRVKAAQAAEKAVRRLKLGRARRKYENLVRKMTDAQDLSSIPNIHLRAFGQYDLDHIISISYGFKTGLPATVLASISNLRIISHSDNRRKGATSDFKAHPLGGLIRV